MTDVAESNGPVLSAADHAHFREKGYVIVRDAVPAANLRAALDAIHAFLGGGRREQWYAPPYSKMGFVPMFHHQALWDNRQHPRVHRAFAELFGTEKLWVTQDQVAIKLPSHPDHPGWGDLDFMHWDCDPRNPPKHLVLQGVLSLTDTAADQGGFQCIPGCHRELDRWIAKFAHIKDWKPMKPDFEGIIQGRATQIPTRAGDLIIWDVRLAHGNCPNRSDRPRYSQYITFMPAREDDEAARRQRIDIFTKRERSGGYGCDERLWELHHTPPAKLTALGRKILGLDRW